MALNRSQKSLVAELGILTGSILLISHILYRLKFIYWIGEYISVIIAVLLLYLPIIVLWRRGREIDFLDRSAVSFSRSLILFLITSLIIFPVFFFFAYFWQNWLHEYQGFRIAKFPNILSVTLYQLFLVALPEEFYFRGYFQSAMNSMFERRWRVLGVELGWGWIITAAVFAFAHSLIVYQWWHFSIFFPALLFGYLRERTGSITAPVFFHAASNILMNWFSRSFF